MSDTVRVRIQASQRVRYDKVVEMTRAEWEELKRMPEKRLTGTGWGDDGHLGGILLHPDDIDDASEMEDFDMRLVDGQGKTLRPVDAWEGLEEDVG